MKTASDGGADTREIPQLLKPDQVANKLGVCVRTLRRMVERPNFPRPVRVGGAVRFDASDIVEYIAHLKAQAGA